jgi:hypothetical protein
MSTDIDETTLRLLTVLNAVGSKRLRDNPDAVVSLEKAPKLNKRRVVIADGSAAVPLKTTPEVQNSKDEDEDTLDTDIADCRNDLPLPMELTHTLWQTLMISTRTDLEPIPVHCPKNLAMLWIRRNGRKAYFRVHGLVLSWRSLQTVRDRLLHPKTWLVFACGDATPALNLHLSFR